MHWITIAVLMSLSTAVPAAEDIEFWIGQPGKHVASAEPNVGQGFGVSFGAQGLLGARVAVTVDLSDLDASRVTGRVSRGGTGEVEGCVTSGRRIRCEWTIDWFNERAFGDIMVYAAPGAALGLAGKVRLTGQRLDEPDTNTANNTGEAVVDVRGPGRSNFSVRVDDVRGSVGETVTVPVTVANAGPNTLKDVMLHRPVAGGGRDFKGGTGCVTSPVPQCVVEAVPPGTTKLVNLRFYIRRCFQPVQGDPDYGASTLGDIGLRYNFADHLETVDPTLELKVNGCAPAPGTGQPRPPADPSPSVSLSAETGPSPAAVQSAVQAAAVDSPPPAAARPVNRTTLLASQAAFAVLALSIVAVLLWRLRKRRDGL